MEKVKVVVDGPPSSTGGFVPPRLPTPLGDWTAPVFDAVAAEAGPPAPIEPISVLDELVDRIADVRHAILASVDGFAVARSTSMVDEPSHPAMLAAAVGLAHQLAAMGGGAQLRQLVVDHDAGLMLVWPIGTQRVLAVLASTRVDQLQLRSFVYDRVSMLSGTTP
jgi:predicted regulator of Ras-like GTPase activity (Roadblock/LC7/MglB family)